MRGLFRATEALKTPGFVHDAEWPGANSEMEIDKVLRRVKEKMHFYQSRLRYPD